MPTDTVAGQAGLDPTLPDVKLILGGQVRQLCYDYNAIVQVERVTGINLLSAAVSVPSFTILGALLWAALLRHDPELALDAIAPLVTPKTAPAIHAAVLAAWFGSTPEPDAQAKGGAKGKRKAQAKTSA